MSIRFANPAVAIGCLAGDAVRLALAPVRNALSLHRQRDTRLDPLVASKPKVACVTALPGAPGLPRGQMLELRGRAPAWVYEVAGPPGAPVLMLLHGLGASAALNWFAAFPALSRHFRLLAPDHRGHGQTPSGSEPFTLAGSAEDSFAVADALGVDRFIAVGYSMGGPIAQLMWRSQPSRIEGLVLAATSRDFGGRLRDRLAFQTIPWALAATRAPGAEAVRSILLQRFARQMTPPMRQWAFEELQRGDSRRILEAAAELGRFSSRDWIRGVDVPTSVIVAMNDQLVPARRQLKLARAIDHSVAAFVEGDHYILGIAPDDFVPVLTHECITVARRARTHVEVLPAYWDLQDESSDTA